MEVVDDLNGLVELAPEWDRLVAEASEDPIFNGHDWVTSWWQVYGTALEAKLHVLTVREHDGELVGLAPLYLEPRGGPRGGRGDDWTVRLLGSGGDTSPDYLGVLAQPGSERVVAAMVAQHLGSPAAGNWDALLLTDLAADAPMTSPLRAALAELPGLLLTQADHAVCPYLHLPATEEEFRDSLPRRLRRQLGRRDRLIAQGGRFALWDDPARIDEGIEQLGELHRRRFRSLGVAQHGFSSAQYLEFHRTVAKRLQQRGQLRLYSLELAGQVVAMLYCLRSGGTLYQFQSGFDPDWAQAGVGNALLVHALEQGIEEGARRFDFLKGEHPYKDEWATGHRQMVRLVGARATGHGVKHLYRWFVRPELARTVSAWRRRLEPPAAPVEVAEPAPVKGAALNGGAARGAALLRRLKPSRRLVKRVVAELMYRGGLLQAGLRLLRLVDGKPRLVVLTYHKVLPRQRRSPGDREAVTAAHFASQVQLLASHFDCPSPAQALAALEQPGARWRGSYPVLLTFDDGYANVLRHAWPVLRTAGVPLLFFVVAGEQGRDGMLWPDEVTERLLACRASELKLRVGPAEERVALGSQRERLLVGGLLKGELKSLPHGQFEQALLELRQAPGMQPLRQHEGTLLLDWRELRRMQREGAVFGSHGHHHRILSRLAAEQLTVETAGSRARLEQELGITARYFAYPNGMSQDISPATVREVAAAGYSHAFTMLPGVATPDDDPLLLPRVAPEDENGAMLGLGLLHQLVREVLADWGVRWAVSSAADLPQTMTSRDRRDGRSTRPPADRVVEAHPGHDGPAQPPPVAGSSPAPSTGSPTEPTAPAMVAATGQGREG